MSDFQFANADELNNLGSASVRYKQNIEALTILNALKENENSALSEADLKTLTRYVGWGSSELINKAFPRSSWGEPTQEIDALLTEDEIDNLRSSSLSAFFTPLPIIAAIYDILDYLGLSKLPSLRILDPAAGTGHFIGVMPSHFRQNTEYVAVEIDRVSATIAGLLYPNAKLHQQPFEDTALPKDFFDLIIGNIPFGDYPVADTSIKEGYLKQQIHDYFFVKAVALARPGAIIAFITSTGTLDKKDDRVRRHLSKHAELLTALRLPNSVFKQNAGTQVITDLIILRKRARPDETAPDRESWIHAEEAPFPRRKGGTARTIINRTFIDDPSRILGIPLIAPSMYNGSEQLTVTSNNTNLRRTILDAITSTLPQDLLLPTVHPQPSPQPRVSPDETLEQEAQDELQSATSVFHANQKQGARATALVDIFTAAKKVLSLQLLNTDDIILHSVQTTLNTLYDKFASRFGYINSKENQKLFRRDNPFV
ncbi:MAG: N-6 DNA methylase, partial [Acidobacteria bacterium]|nr:N-6 DNA methylase [Acidobacteriota bacterium]